MPIIEAKKATRTASAAVVKAVLIVFSRNSTALAVSKPDPDARMIKYPSGMLAKNRIEIAESCNNLGTATPPADFRLGAAAVRVKVKASQP